MTWKSHAAIATAVTLPFNPALLPVAVAGSTAPDWLEWVGNFFGAHIEHRKQTHYLIIPIALIAISFVFDYRDILFWFGIGYLTHWFADSVTISGVPISPWDKRKIHFFGGAIRTGEPIEYVYSFGLLALSIFVFKPAVLHITQLGDKQEQAIEFNPYNMQYRDLFEKKIIDEKEMVERRFKFF